MPSLSQPFRLAILPKIAVLSDYNVQSKLLQVADDFTLDSNKITIGVSGCAVSQYVINPTPNVSQTVPIPSTNNVTACNVAQYKDADTEELFEIWVYNLAVNKKNTLHVAIKTVDPDKFSTTQSDALETYTVKCDASVVGIKINKEDKTIVVTLGNGFIQIFDFKLKLLNSVNTSYDNIYFSEHFVENKKSFAIILSTIEGNKLSYKLYELFGQDKTSIKELSSTILEDIQCKDSKISYQFGKLYRLYKNQMFVYSLPQCQLVDTITLPQIDLKKSQAISFKPVSNNRILLTVDNKIFILDLVHRATLAERVLGHVKMFQLLKSVVIETNDASNNHKTIAIGVSVKNGPSPITALEIINANVGTGTLKDSLGNSFDVSKSFKSNILQPLFTDDANLVKRHDFKYEAILKKLSSTENDIKKFDDIFFGDLYIQQNYYTDNERFIFDVTFLSDVIDLIFKNFQKEYPSALTFLLTHPLFPIHQTKNLLLKLREHPRLFKQAVVTCPNLPIDELLTELFSITNGELSVDISLRILQDYTKDSIKLELKNLNKIDIQNFIDFVIDPNNEEEKKHNEQLFVLLSLVLDASGLFSIEGPLLTQLSEYIDKQVEMIEKSNKLWHLIDGTLGKRNNHYQTSGATVPEIKALTAYSVEYLEL
ncbi:hypothetical protein TPHA_0D04230 [Tetrapisispora phaffii CBS 4417]|uniref:U3 small nucleolar RNA-associated protein 8 n=1 Tax=Tetrapisispora phaffii (strain ATCC 24235 / CBS 4417 / NBRC 1672 / NRRL Y-8282 / UCD 70-5) TaxID=1071381 RepID=G8BRY2_TETPH|nr:hypothetical protein TPHA_0D04230 [Tetrapisispora phaffii CBS 4417]CCE63057.1 hypothetical protein TPHA_0D04230 [Tetrapisispora phaffii CBS 4417]